jgi:replication-associated recombination protein RarA
MFESMLLSPFTRTCLENYMQSSCETSQSVILSGEKGLGKRNVGEILAKFLLNYGGEYPLEKHPDFYLVEPKDGLISKEMADEIREMANVRVSIAPRRVFLIDDANLMGTAAANSLLKTIEDENKTSVFILVAHQRLLPTIVSRCIEVAFQVLPEEELVSFLSTEEAVDNVAIASSGGRIGLYYYYTENSSFMVKMLEILNTLNTMDHSREILNVCHAMKEKDGKYLFNYLEGPNERLGFLSLIQSVFRQHILFLSGCGNEMPFMDGVNMSRFYSLESSLEVLEALDRAMYLSRRKGRYSKNDFFELLCVLAKEREVCVL